MGRWKSSLSNIQITEAGRAHDCRHNKSHRIEKGDKRLTIRENRRDHNYCIDCGLTILEKDIEKLKSTYAELKKHQDGEEKYSC